MDHTENLVSANLKFDPNILYVTEAMIASLNSRKILGEDMRDIVLDLMMLTVDLYKKVGVCLTTKKGNDENNENNVVYPVVYPVDSPFPCLLTIIAGAPDRRGRIPWDFKIEKNVETTGGSRVIQIKYEGSHFIISDISDISDKETNAQGNKQIWRDGDGQDPMLVAAITIVRCVLRKCPQDNYAKRIKFVDKFATEEVRTAIQNMFPFDFIWVSDVVGAEKK
jgi:hypothetical protein